MTAPSMAVYTHRPSPTAYSKGFDDTEFFNLQRALAWAQGAIDSLGLNNVTRPMGTATGDGTTDDRNAFATTASPRYAPAGRYRIGSNLTLDGSTLLAPGAVLVPDSGVTISFTGPLVAAITQVFDLSAGGTVTMSGAANPVSWASWWGAAYDGITNDSVPINQAIQSIDTSGGKGGTVALCGGPCNLGSAAVGITLRQYVKVQGAGRRGTLAFYSGSGAAVLGDSLVESGLSDCRIGIISAGAAIGISLLTTTSSVLNCGFERLDIVASATTVGQIGVSAVVSGGQIISENWWNDIQVDSFELPLYLKDTEGNVYRDWQIPRGGSASATIGIDAEINAETMSIRMAGLGTGCPGLTGLTLRSGSRNMIDLITDLNIAPSQALDVTGTQNIIRVTRPVGFTPIGTFDPTNIVIDADVGLVSPALTLSGVGGGTGVVTAGVADSGGVGFRLLRVPN